MKPKIIIFFDGGCSLCAALIAFILKKDKGHRFEMQPLDTPEALPFIEAHPTLDTLIVVDGTSSYVQSEAVRHILKNLGGVWPVLGWLLALIPRFLRNHIYAFIAKRRHCLIKPRK